MNFIYSIPIESLFFVGAILCCVALIVESGKCDHAWEYEGNGIFPEPKMWRTCSKCQTQQSYLTEAVSGRSGWANDTKLLNRSTFNIGDTAAIDGEDYLLTKRLC